MAQCNAYMLKADKHCQYLQMPISVFYFSDIFPSVLYCIVIWGSLSHIAEVHIHATRFIKKIPKKIPDNFILPRANWKLIEICYKRAIDCKAYKIYYTKKIFKANLPTFTFKFNLQNGIRKKPLLNTKTIEIPKWFRKYHILAHQQLVELLIMLNLFIYYYGPFKKANDFWLFL